MTGPRHVPACSPLLLTAFFALTASALGGCGGNEGAEEPALVSAGTGIPMGARGAEGVRFNAAQAGSVGELGDEDFDEPHHGRPPRMTAPKAPPPPTTAPPPPNPFGPEELPDPDGGAPAPVGPKPKKKGTHL